MYGYLERPNIFKFIGALNEIVSDFSWGYGI